MWNVVWQAHNQYIEEGLNKDTIILYQERQIKSKDIRITQKDIVINEHKKIVLGHIKEANKQKDKLRKMTTAVLIESGILIILTIIIILK